MKFYLYWEILCENSLAASHKTKCVLRPITAPWACVYPTEMETDWRSHKNLWANVYSSLIHNSPKLETMPTASSGWMVKHMAVRSHRGVLLSNKKERATDTRSNLDGSFRLNEKSHAQKVTLHTMWFHSYHIPKMVQVQKGRRDEWLSRVRWEWGGGEWRAIEGQRGRSCGAGNTLDLFFILTRGYIYTFFYGFERERGSGGRERDRSIGCPPYAL